MFYKIGIPDVKFFIRGDEVDFLSRVKKAGLKYGTLATVAVQHPATWTEMKPVFGGFLTPLFPRASLSGTAISATAATSPGSTGTCAGSAPTSSGSLTFS
ncbi:hypothetical protein [Arthrobacter sp. H16F315]|uniref:hypothetical protein n=1 Tax=Arthrobacter sp. H16F315 TaxID=2955314 RepID=UPI003158FFEE